LFKVSFPVGQRLGIHVIPNHFYYPVPDTRLLGDDLWTKPSDLVGIDMNDTAQRELLGGFAAEFHEEYEQFPRQRTSSPHSFYLNNNRFESVDAEILYCMVRKFKPARIFEIGSGNSTCLSAQALLRNQAEDGKGAELIACEPYPNPVLRAGFPGLSELIPKRVQEIPLQEFSKLQRNDILFIDSSHVVSVGSDVQYEILEILPRLNPGTLIHFHDIFLPAEYPKAWVLGEYKFWSEQYLLQAFLAFNTKYEVIWAGSYMHFRHPDALADAFSSYQRQQTWPASFWIRKIA
jgi:predicted O-methyltransferase YrrM